MTNRHKLINEIIQKAGDEFETPQDYLELAIKTDAQLIKEIIKIDNYILNNKI
tara:strand:+ start:1048 stop:1206 length:159 start_codon:yes stop_codon:yes gene_type:complete